MVHPRPKTPQWEPVVKHVIVLLIILNLACKSDIKEAHGILSNPLFKQEYPWAETYTGSG